MSDNSQKPARMPRRLFEKFFSAQLDLRVRLFYILGFAGILLSLYAGVVIDDPVRSLIACCAAVFSALLILYAMRTGRYERCFYLAVIVIFFGLFAALLLTGGASGSLILLPVLGVLFTVMLIKGWKGLLIASLEILYFTGLLVLICRNPQWYPPDIAIEPWFARELSLGFLVLCSAIMLCVYGMMRLYDQQKEQLEAHGNLIEEVSRRKTQFLANASHEMRTPLTVISVNVQVVLRLLRRQDSAAKAPEIESLLQNAQSEIMRLARMVNGMLSLASISDGADKRKTDFSEILQSAAEILCIHLLERSNALETAIEERLIVFADADLLSQVIVNLIENAHQHTENGTVQISASREAGVVHAMVRDNGSGIAPALLPRVFERGVSDGGGKGLGLDFCKTVIESHGGTIWAESEAGKGTAVYFTIPLYEGQLGGDGE